MRKFRIIEKMLELTAFHTPFQELSDLVLRSLFIEIKQVLNVIQFRIKVNANRKRGGLFWW